MAGSYTCEQLGKLASVQGGYAFKSDDFTDSGVPVLKIKNVRHREIDAWEVEYVSKEVARANCRYFCKTGDILISMTGSWPQAPSSVVGRVARFVGPSDTYLINQRVGRIVIKKPRKLNLRFLFYVLTQSEIQWHLVSIATGSANQANISGSQIESLDIPLPPLPEQRAITHILGTLDDKIELNRRTNETLETMARAIFKSWFVNFDPVRAKAEGRDPDLPKPLADLFPDSLEESELGRIPATWRIVKLGDLIDLVYGKALKEENRQPGSVAVYGSNGQVGWHNARLAGGPGIIVGRKGNPGVVTWIPTDFFAIDTTFYVVPKAECSSLYFLFYALRGHGLGSLGADSAVPGLNRSMVYRSKQLVPSTAVLHAFDHRVRPLFDRIHAGGQQSLLLAELRDALLPRLISGKLRVHEMGTRLKEACTMKGKAPG